MRFRFASPKLLPSVATSHIRKRCPTYIFYLFGDYPLRFKNKEAKQNFSVLFLKRGGMRCFLRYRYENELL